MKIELKTFALPVLLVAAVAVGGMWWCFRTRPSAEGEAEDGSVTYRSRRILEKGRKANRVEHRIGNASNRKGVPSAKSVRRQSVPDEIEKLSEDELNGLCKDLMEELRDVAGSDNLRRIRKIIARFDLPESKGGLGGMVPRVLRRQAVATLGLCGAAAIPDLADFLSDGSSEVANQAMEEIKDNMSDPELSDQELADLLVTMMKGMSDSDDISMMLMEFSGMKNSIKGEALQRILETGSSQAKKVLKRELQIYTEIDVTDADSLKDWTDQAKKLEAGRDESLAPVSKTAAQDKGTAAAEPAAGDGAAADPAATGAATPVQ